jgi:uncharacterized protein (TIGR02145 family)
MKNLIPILLAVVVLSGCDSAETSTENQHTNCGEIEHEGYSYSTVQIGDQCWFAENCRYLPSVSPSKALMDSPSEYTTPLYYVYEYQGTDVDEAKATSKYKTYGVLYNWTAVMTEGICPSGWHIPSDEEFKQLRDFCGYSIVTEYGEKRVVHGMKSTSGWEYGNGSNSSGFTGLPGGCKESDGVFTDYRANGGLFGCWWTSSSIQGGYSPDHPAYMLNSYWGNTTRKSNYPETYGFSARCVRD